MTLFETFQIIICMFCFVDAACKMIVLCMIHLVYDTVNNLFLCFGLCTNMCLFDVFLFIDR